MERFPNSDFSLLSLVLFAGIVRGVRLSTLLNMVKRF